MRTATSGVHRTRAGLAWNDARMTHSPLIVMPSYVRAGLPDDMPNVVLLDEHGDLPDDVLAGAEFYVRAYYAGRHENALIARMPNLRVIQTLTAGVDDVLPYLPSGVTLCNAAGVHDASTAELTVALMLVMQRGLHEYRDRQHNGDWQHEFRPALADARVLIVGAGHIARAIAVRLAPFEVEVTRVARTARVDDLGAVYGIEELDRLLPLADIVSIIVPHTKDTHHLVDRGFLQKMKSGALLINTARGKVVDTEALLEALQAGSIRAAMDVTDPEPLPADHPLWRAPNCFITPHIGGDTSAFQPRATALVAQQVHRWLHGEDLRNIIVRG